MKPFKLSACLVTLILVCLPLQAGQESAFAARTWTDLKGRAITATLVSSDFATGMVRIKRSDGQEFTVSLATFSPEDRAYVKVSIPRPEYIPLEKDIVDHLSVLGEYNKLGIAPLDASLESWCYAMTTAFKQKNVVNLADKPLTISLSQNWADARTNLDKVPAVATAAQFIEALAKVNHLKIKEDREGNLVLFKDEIVATEVMAAKPPTSRKTDSVFGSTHP